MATKVEKIYIEIQTPLLLNTRHEHETILDLWASHIPEYLPDRYGNSEPIDRIFDLSKREEILTHFRWPFLAVKEKPKLDTSIWMRSPKKHLHSSWKLSFTFGEINVNRLISFLRAAAKQLAADFCCLTLFTDSEIDFGRRNRTAWNLDKKATRFFFAIHSQFLQQCLPDVYWLTIFGPPYVKLFGEEKILSAPASQTEVIGQKMVLMQLTPRLEDVRNTATFRDLKSRVKAHLGADTFYQPGQVGEARHPQFLWENEPGIK
jgi:hypothetical protein